MKILLFALLLTLAACTPQVNPVTDGPQVGAGDGTVDTGRTLFVTQRAPENSALTDVYVTLLASLDTGTEVERVDITSSPGDTGAYTDDERCFEIDGQPLVTCELGDLAANEAAPGIEVVLGPGVRLSCAGSGFVAGEVAGYRPLICTSAAP